YDLACAHRIARIHWHLDDATGDAWIDVLLVEGSDAAGVHDVPDNRAPLDRSDRDRKRRVARGHSHAHVHRWAVCPEVGADRPCACRDYDHQHGELQQQRGAFDRGLLAPAVSAEVSHPALHTSVLLSFLQLHSSLLSVPVGRDGANRWRCHPWRTRNAASEWWCRCSLSSALSWRNSADCCWISGRVAFLAL